MVRIKHRYLLVHILYPDSADSCAKKPPDRSLPDLVEFHRPSPDNLTPQLLSRAIRDHILILYGDYGLGLVSGSLNVKYLSPATSTAIVRCSRANYRLVWAALSFMTQLPITSRQSQPRSCALRVVRVSGTIKKAEEEAIKRARAAILRAKRENREGSIEGLMAILDGGDENDFLGSAVKGGEQTRAGLDVSEEEIELGIASDGDD